MPNRLAGETSPYLLQHQNNPVDWYPWGTEALERAREESKPIFLSIGYAACHWCHVMEHESFKNEVIAAQLNEAFVCIKVDREERPDLDQIYMNAVQIMTGRGGWPMSVFLTPDLQPFYGGTYWPPAAKMGMPGFPDVITAIADIWKNRREEATEQAGRLTQQIVQIANLGGELGELNQPLLMSAAADLERMVDSTYGGFGGAPKFPHPMELRLLLRIHRRHPREELLKIVTLALDKMAAGGIYDQLGGGFHRYSVDVRWLVPHFEKMLYDNALLAGAYLDAYQVTGDDDYARVARETLDYVLREMQHAEGGFFSTQDADSEGVEGKFFVWKPQAVRDLLGEDEAKTFAYVYDVSEEGNFEGDNILNLHKPLEVCAQILERDLGELKQELADSRDKLLAARESRIHPGLDDKVLVSWNGLMIDSMAQAAGVLDEPKYLAAATRAADFIWAQMRRDDGRLLHTWREGRAHLDAYLDDYGCLANALVTLYEASFAERHIDRAVQLAEMMLEFFHDRDQGGFFFTASDHEELIARQKDYQDNAVPSGGSMAALALLRLAKLTGRSDFAEAAEETLQSAAGLMQQSAMATGQMRIALDFYLGPTPELVLTGSDEVMAPVLRDLRHRYLPNHVVARRTQAEDERSPHLAALFAGRESDDDEPTLYVCENFTCREPIQGVDAIAVSFGELGQAENER